jgi:hypothetical protein
MVKKVTFNDTLEIFTYDQFSKIDDTPWFKKIKSRILRFIKKFNLMINING